MADAAPSEEQPKLETGAPAGDDDDNGVVPDEEAEVDFKPLVQLEEVAVKSGEEEEEVVFKMRAKLFRWESDSWEKEVKMWKERGTGDIKFLKHKETGEVRCLMRREKTMKICANFYLKPSIALKENAGSDRSWVWQCADFSEEKEDISVLAIRFANSENALKFKEVFEASKSSNADGATPAPPAEKKEEAAPAEEPPKADAAAEPPKADAAAEGEDAKEGAEEAAEALGAVKIADAE